MPSKKDRNKQVPPIDWPAEYRGDQPLPPGWEATQERADIKVLRPLPQARFEISAAAKALRNEGELGSAIYELRRHVIKAMKIKVQGLPPDKQFVLCGCVHVMDDYVMWPTKVDVMQPWPIPMYPHDGEMFVGGNGKWGLITVPYAGPGQKESMIEVYGAQFIEFFEKSPPRLIKLARRI